MGDKAPLKGPKGSYGQDGRAVSSLGSKCADSQTPKGASTGMSGDKNSKGSGDPGRRNK